MLAVAGGNGKVVVWNLEHNPGVRNHFPNTNAHAAKPERPEVTGAIEDFDDSASEGEEEEGDLEMAGSGDSDNEDIQDR